MSREIPRSASGLIHRAAEEPGHKYAEEPCTGVCATCAGEIDVGVSTEEINNPTFSNHAEFFKFGTHVCRACAWLYGQGKGRPGSIFACETYLRPVISLASVEDGRPAWDDVLSSSPEGVNAGVLTTDSKPRVWPRMRLSGAGAFGLYVHAPEYDVSEYRALSPSSLKECREVVREALIAGYSKARVHRGLLSDYSRTKKSPAKAVGLERALEAIRGSPEFVPTLIATQVTKEEKDAADNGGADRRREARSHPREDDDRLF